jgi:hypothetical protein
MKLSDNDIKNLEQNGMIEKFVRQRVNRGDIIEYVSNSKINTATVQNTMRGVNGTMCKVCKVKD